MQVPAAGSWWSFRQLRSTSRWGSFALLAISWIFLCQLHWSNDGLWYQGDAPRHALNGLFWKDYLLSGTLNPKAYALQYYARYPAISPASYPPMFYLLEALLFGLFGPSARLAKLLVLAFAFLAAVYTTAWLRRWVAGNAGWGGALLLLLPGLVHWSHAVMLNVPAFALSLAALYHARRCLENRGRPLAYRQLGIAVAFSLAAVLTYYPAALGLLVIPAWAVCGEQVKLGTPGGAPADATGAGSEIHHGRLRWPMVALLTAILLAPAAWVAVKWAPTHVRWAIPLNANVLSLGQWVYYPQQLLGLAGVPLLAAATAGMFAGWSLPRWRRESMVLTVWIFVLYVVFSLIQAREGRYVLLMLVPLVGFAAIGVSALGAWGGGLLFLPAKRRRFVVTAAAGLLLSVQAWQAWGSRLPEASGFAEVAAFFRHRAPTEAVLYDGLYDGVFVYHVRAGDPGFRQQVVLGNKLLYAFALVPGWRQREFAATPEEVVEALRRRGGCRWLALEMQTGAELLPAAQRLRDTVQRDEFEHIATFPIRAEHADRVEVYRLNLAIESPEFVDLPFPILGNDVEFQVRPLRSREED